MNPNDIRNALRLLHEKEGRDAAIMGTDRGLCPYHISPDKENWERGYDSYAGRDAYSSSRQHHFAR